MATPTITFNSSTGSDTAASGSGGTAITAGGNNSASTTSGSADVDLSADAPDLSSLSSPDGSQVLWVDTSTGRQFSVINSVNNTTKVVTCANTFGSTASGLNWGIGGKRATIDNADSRKLFADATGGWRIEIEDNTAGTITSSAITCSASGTSAAGPIIIDGNSNTINTTANASLFVFTGTNWCFEDCTFTCSNATRTSSVALQSNTTTTAVTAKRCIFGDSTNKLNNVCTRVAGSQNITLSLLDCEVKYLLGSMIDMGAASGSYFLIDGCYVHDCGSNGIYIGSSMTTVTIIVRNCISVNNTGVGIYVALSSANSITITGCTVVGNSSHGVQLYVTANTTFMNNTITANGGYGTYRTSQELNSWCTDFNNYGTGGTANTSGARNNFPTGANDLAVDPGFAGSGVYTPGTNLKAAGFPSGSLGFSGSTSYVDIGAVQREEPAGGSGGMLVHSGMSGGIRG